MKVWELMGEGVQTEGVILLGSQSTIKGLSASGEVYFVLYVTSFIVLFSQWKSGERCSAPINYTCMFCISFICPEQRMLLIDSPLYGINILLGQNIIGHLSRYGQMVYLT